MNDKENQRIFSIIPITSGDLLTIIMLFASVYNPEVSKRIINVKALVIPCLREINMQRIMINKVAIMFKAA